MSLSKALLTSFLSRHSTAVIAGVRDPSNTSSKALHELPVGHGSKVIVVQIGSSSETDAATAIKELQSVHNVKRFDVVIANDGAADYYKCVADLSVAEVQEHIAVNSIGPFLLFQAVYPLLKESAKAKFVVLESPADSIGGMESRPFPYFTYGASKVVAHYLTRKIHFENELANCNTTLMVPSSSFVQTDMGNQDAVFLGMAEAPTTIKDSVDYRTTTIDGSTREKTCVH
ncbi:hypothetical protein MMC17_003362 [Xylographa soralifera]|nr:hypothetical protein [Xylographa soralifera]